MLAAASLRHGDRRSEAISIVSASSGERAGSLAVHESRCPKREGQPVADGTRSVTMSYSRGTECCTSCVWACGLLMICSSLGTKA